MLAARKETLEFIEDSKALVDRKDDIRVRFHSMLRYRYGDGIFEIDRDLICFVRMLIDQGNVDGILIDSLHNPIVVSDLREFYDRCFGMYFEATNFYKVEYEKIKATRDTLSVNGIAEHK